VAANPPAPKSDALARNEWPQPEAKPKVVATPPPVKKQVVSATVSPKAEAKPIALGAKKPKSPAPAIAKPTPGIASAVPAAPKSEDSEIKKAFLATRAESNAATETRQAIPVTPSPQPLVASNAEAAAPRTPAPVAVSKQVETTPPASVAKALHVAPRPSEYTLAAGDNLYMVSRKLRVSYNDLMQANGLSDPRQLRVGQKLKVPAEQMASL
jgi:LysM repeat protein